MNAIKTTLKLTGIATLMLFIGATRPAVPAIKNVVAAKVASKNAEGITASGHTVSYNGGRFVAADTDVLPFKTKLIIPGYNAAPVEVIDRGGAIKGNKLDLYYPTHEEAMEWGRQIVDVIIVD